MTKKEISNEVEILKKLSSEGISFPLDLNDIKVVIDYVCDLEKQVNNYKETIDLIISDLRVYDYIHKVDSNIIHP